MKENVESDYSVMYLKTITVDNGVEFSDAEGLEKSRRNKKKKNESILLPSI